jgi:N-methylhydantoinase A
MLLGVDTGGTFTDFVLVDESGIRVHKVLSTPDAPERAILEGLRAMRLEAEVAAGKLLLIHGSTVATNAALEGKGVRTAFITNRGFGDMLTIGRQARSQLYELQATPLPAPVPAELCLETGGRINHLGELLEALTDADLRELADQIHALQPDAVAINLLYSYVDRQYEKLIEETLPRDLFISRSSNILPEYKEYERGIATWLNAWLGPLVSGYLQRLETALKPSPVTIMQSSGGTMAAAQAAGKAVNLLLSGPAGGLAGAFYMGERAGKTRLISFDMGGTSTDVALLNGTISLTNEGRIGRWPVAVPMVDMQTIGAGGGSIASLDAGGMLHVGPQSAGAAPGPACYGNGGTAATVTDANLVLGRLQAEHFLGGQMLLDRKAAQQAVEKLATTMGMSTEAAAEGIVRVANEHMSRALRAISIERGHNPEAFTLCCFGGAGGLHVCELAEQLGLRRALVPVHAGVLSALGMLVAPRQRQLTRTFTQPLLHANADAIERALSDLAETGRRELLSEGVSAREITTSFSLDLRYCGQSFTLNTPWQGSASDAVDAFHSAHRSRYGHAMGLMVELVNLRAAVSARSTPIELPRANFAKPQEYWVAVHGIERPVALMQRDMLAIDKIYSGPLLVAEQASTTWLKPGWQLLRDESGSLQLYRAGCEQPGPESKSQGANGKIT